MTLSHKRYGQKPFPPYTYIPGKGPHPVRDPKGHSYKAPEPIFENTAPHKWGLNEEYLYGVDLYNHGFWWESHEAWEGLWHLTNKDKEHGQFLQGLIQVSAAFIKWELKQTEGLKKLFEIGFARLERVEKKHPQFMGLDLKVHLPKLKSHFDPVIDCEAQGLTNWEDHYPYLELE